MSEKNEKDAAGKALYLEFRKETYTYQLIVTPDTVSLNKQSIIPSNVMSRRISTWHPRRNWAFTSRPVPGTLTARDANGDLEPMLTEHARGISAHRAKTIIGTLLDTLVARGYTLYKHPLFVEFSYKDIQAIAEGKTPNDLYRRIIRSREAFGWDSALVLEPASV